MLCERKKCTGCFSCLNACPKDAISMEEDDYGNIYPKIDKSKCINCKQCETVCPQIEKKIKVVFPVKAYAVYSKNKKIRSSSSSGGVATQLTEKIIEEHGIVYGASNLLNNENFKFIRIENRKDVTKLQGSKYTHCYINKCYKEAKADLNNNKKVLFIGTPCQISGLKTYLKKEYENLITIDLVCHGVASQKLLFEDLKNNNIDKKDICKIFFRDENGFNIKVLNNKEKNIYYSKSIYNHYYKNFLRGNIYRENCYSCNFAQIKRCSDITIGDFWGLEKKSKIYDNELKGISLVLINTENGNAFFEKYKNCFIYEERTIAEAQKYNKQLNHPTKMTKKYSLYLKKYPKNGYLATMKKMNTLKDIIRKNQTIQNIYNFLKNRK